MRLTEQEKLGLIDAIEQTSPLKTAELRLYGSRVDDTKKGGDIDLLLIVPNKELKENVIRNKPEILVSMKNNIGDRKIDLLICDAEAVELDPFIELVYPQSIVLKKWD